MTVYHILIIYQKIKIVEFKVMLTESIKMNYKPWIALAAAIICYVIPFLNFNLFFTNWIFFALIIWIINSKSIHILKIGLFFGTSTVLIGEYWIPGTIKNLSGVNTAVSLTVHFLYAIYESLFFVAIFLFAKKILSLKKGFRGIKYLTIILCYIILEEYYPRIFPYNLGNTQILFNSLSQHISILGLNFLTFIVLMINFIFFEIFINKKVSKIILIGMSAMILILISWDPTYSSTDKERLKVVILQPNNIKENLNTMPNNKNFDLTIWPENSYKLIDLDNKEFFTIFKQDFSNNHVFHTKYLLFGAITKKNNSFFNSSILIDQDKRIINIKNKKNLLMFGEFYPFQEYLSKLIPIFNNFINLSKGKNILQEIGTIKSLVLICYEDLFREDVHKIFKNENPSILINITNDIWYGETIASYQHLMLSIPLSIETQRYLIRSTNNGVTAVISNKGEIINMIEPFKFGTIEHEVPMITQKSKYVEYKVFIDIIGTLLFITFLTILFKENRKIL